MRNNRGGRSLIVMFASKHLVRQCVAASACFVESVGCGVVMAFTGTLFPQLEADDTFRISKEDETWIASSAILSMAFGCILGGVSLAHLARKLIVTSTNVLMLVGFLTLYLSRSVALLLAGRMLCGLSMGMSRPAVITIVAEIAPPNLRTTFTNLIMLGHVAGALLSDTTATLLSWRLNALITCAYPLLAALAFILLPETYGSHLGRCNYASAAASFHYYRGCDASAQAEINRIVTKARNDEHSPTTQDLWSSIDRKFLRAFLVCATFFAAGQLNGVNVLSLYSVQIFQGIFVDVNANYITIGYDSVKILASLTSLYAIRRFKLRTLTFVSAAGVIASLFALSLFYYLQKNTPNNMEASRYNILTSIVLILYVQFLLCGLAPLPWVAPPELFESRLSGLGSGATIFINYIIYFLAVKFSPALLDVSYSLTFSVFGVVTGVLTGILWFILPETKDKTLLDAQASINI